jgi:hypothetical protein
MGLLYWFLVVAQIVGAALPLVSIAIIISKEQNSVSSNLLLANVGCLILNCCSGLITRSTDWAEGYATLRVMYIGNVMMMFFFARFLVSYFHVKRVKTFFRIWIILDIIGVALLWTTNGAYFVYDNVVHGFFKNCPDFAYVTYDFGIFYRVRMIVILWVYIFGLIMTKRYL